MRILRNVGAGGAAVLDDATIAAIHQTLAGAGGLYSPIRVLFTLIGADMNSTSDQSFTKLGTFTSYLPIRLSFTNVSTSLTTAAGGVYTAAAKGGTALVAAAQAYSGANATGAGGACSFAPLGAGPQTATPILSLSTPQGGAATADFYYVGSAIS